MANQDSITTLYNGQHTATFKNNSHRYYVDGKLKPGVTTILGKIIAKPELMLWPLNMAMGYLETRLPTITLEDLAEARNAHVRKRDGAADVGTEVHGAAEDYLRNPETQFPYGNYSDEAQPPIARFIEWCQEKQVKTIAVEQVVYSQFKDFAGTFDSILEIEGRVYLCDLKTSNASRGAPKGIYSEYFIQLGGYYYAYEEQRLYEIEHGGTNLRSIDDLMVISCKKDGSNVDTLTASDVGLNLNDAMHLWTSTLLLHTRLKEIKGKLGVK